MDTPALDLGVTMTSKQIEHFTVPQCYEGYLTDLWVSEGDLDSRMQRVAQNVVNYYGHDDFTILVVLKGSIFVNDVLQKHLRQIYSHQNIFRPLVVTDYIKCQSYSNTTSNQKVQIQNISESVVRGKRILIVEDIIDTGHTLTNLASTLESMGPKDIQFLTMIKKTGVTCCFP